MQAGGPIETGTNRSSTDISDIATGEYRSVTPEKWLGSVQSILETDGVLVTDAATDGRRARVPGRLSLGESHP